MLLSSAPSSLRAASGFWSFSAPSLRPGGPQAQLTRFLLKFGQKISSSSSVSVYLVFEFHMIAL